MSNELFAILRPPLCWINNFTLDPNCLEATDNKPQSHVLTFRRTSCRETVTWSKKSRNIELPRFLDVLPSCPPTGRPVPAHLTNVVSSHACKCAIHLCYMTNPLGAVWFVQAWYHQLDDGFVSVVVLPSSAFNCGPNRHGCTPVVHTNSGSVHDASTPDWVGLAPNYVAYINQHAYGIVPRNGQWRLTA